MKKFIVPLGVTAMLMTGCTAEKSAPSSTAQSSSTAFEQSAEESESTSLSESVPSETDEEVAEESAEQVSEGSKISKPQKTENDAATVKATTVPTVVPASVSTPAPAPASTPVPMPTSVPTPVPTPAPTEAPKAQITAYGEIPFSQAAGTGEWWQIDSTDSAYQATADNINAIRAAGGLAPLTLNADLSTAANARCESFVAGGPFDHSGMTTLSEICAQGAIGSAQAVCTAWQGSSDHYANIMRTDISQMGVACWFCATEQGNYTYWTVTFG